MASRTVSRSVLRRLRCVGSHQSTSSWSSVPTPATYGTPASFETPEADAVSASSDRIVVESVANQLKTQGYAVVDGALDGLVDTGETNKPKETLAETLRRELMTLTSTPGVMVPNATVLVSKDGSQSKLEKASIMEAEMHNLDEEILSTVPALRAVAENRSTLTLLNVMIPSTSNNQLHHQVVKLQKNTGDGGCFPLHFDADALVDGRKITQLTYLNPEWKPGDGGELILYPFPMDKPIVIEPIMGRTVLFAAQHMLHRVAPSNANERLCFTTWFFAKNGGKGMDGDKAEDSDKSDNNSSDNTSSDTPYSPVAWQQARELCKPHLRKHLQKAVFAEQWAASILESHPPSPVRDLVLATHQEEVEKIMRALAGKFPEGIQLIAHVAENGTREEKGRMGVRWL